MTNTKNKIHYIGNYQKIVSNTDLREGIMEINVSPVDMVKAWKRCGLTSNFVASFYGYSHAEAGIDESKMTKLKNIVSTALNELVENGAKYSADLNQYIGIIFRLYDQYLMLEVMNYASESQFNSFKTILDDLVHTKDYETLYFKHLEDKANNPEETAGKSNLGLLMLLKDFNVELAGKFEEPTGKKDKYKISILCKINKKI